MAAGVPPPPLNSPSGSYYWLEWYTSLTNFLNGTNIPWSNLNFTGSNLTDIQTRNHNDLQNIQGGVSTMHYHTAGFGYVDSAASTPKLPTGWSVSHSGTGVYLITHNLGLIAPDYMAGACSNTAGTIVAYVALTSSTTLTVHTTNFAGTATDGSFSFWVTAI